MVLDVVINIYMVDCHHKVLGLVKIKSEKVMVLRTTNAFYGFKNIFDCKYIVSAFQRWVLNCSTTSEHEKIAV